MEPIYLQEHAEIGIEIYKSLFDASQDGILIYMGNNLVDCNEKALEIFQCPIETLQFHIPYILSPEFQSNGEKTEILASKYLHRAYSGIPQRFEWIHKRLTGDEFDAEIVLFPFYFKEKQYLTVIVRDITKRKIIEKELDILRKSLEQKVDEKTLHLAQANAELEQLNEELKTANEELHQANEEANTILKNLEEEIALRKEIQKNLESSEEILNSFISQSSEGISLLDSEGKIIVWNKKMNELTGIKPEQAIGNYSWDVESMVTPPKEYNKTEKIKKFNIAYLENLKNSKPFVLAGPFNRADGVQGHLEVSIFPIITSSTQFVGRISRDLTEKKLTETKLEKYRKQLEELLEIQKKETIQTAQQLLATIQALPDYIFILDEEGCFIDAYAPAGKDFSIPKEKFLRKHVKDILPPEIAIKVQDSISKIEKNDTIEIFECEFAIGNEIKFKEDRMVRLGTSKFLIIERDITEVKKANLEEKESQEKFRAIFNNSLDLISLMDFETQRYIDANTCLLEITGKTRSEFIGKTRDELGFWHSQKDKESFEKMIKEGGRIINIEMQWNIKEVPRYFLVSSEIITIARKKAILTISKDIHDTHILTKALKESELKFRTLFMNSQDGILLSRLDRRIIEMNPVLLNLFRIEKYPDLKDQYITDFVPQEYLPQLKERLANLIKREPTSLLEIPFKTATRGEVTFEINSPIITLGDEDVVFTVARDITERKLLQKKIIAASMEAEERERKKIASNLHDDVGPLLSSMNMHLSLLARKKEIQPYLDKIQLITRILKDTISTVREISNNISPHILMNYGLISALNAFFETKSDILPVKMEQGFNEFQISGQIQLVLFRMIKELYNNSMKHAQAKVARIKFEQTRNQLLVLYSDDGIGFDLDILQKPGQGMGLANIISRIQAIGGSYHIHTKKQEGFRIEVIIPIEQN